MISPLLGLTTFLLITLSIVTLNNAKNLPSYIKPCKRKDPNLEKCLINLIRSLEPRLPKGLPEMRIPPLDPFRLPEVRLNQQGTGSVNFQAIFKNVIAEGARKFNISALKIDFKAPSILINISFPKIVIHSDYTIKGKILLVPINGNGKSNGTFTNVDSSVNILGKYEKRNGKTYLSGKQRKININLGGLSIYFSNLFNGNKELSDSTNKFVNENWREIINEVKPLIEDTLGEIMLQITKGLLDLYPLEDLIPDN